ncbi:hypothetical protein PHYBLDRAFT_187385 [Phycomyces blakesleeanus NRRL 1555(-)]|uniref:B30.2/SPRY domain-containing protein n=2 Tax=Phycomyces blakesleeanus TaxID=4837 RepID=A0A162U079_PHYB8|nr:hypothetical protein PHYBLDRAFT_187385 [Phycomyces blakesleeanus NRRL 1555(-)]OAD72432.1 hypothetical protein PHYBLDRAFT_187385 [Phycomyces blakesleeanus NRRL 1555(-)]|eukprot:XP_018290472.1 hypothetical protein PHYBLDRAFT_187385 [Phycomyces blakesleeanus NRRL 1555(-)]
MTTLTWNETHTLNVQHKYCYCGQDRNLLEICLQCKFCRNWFHSKCTQVSNPPDLLFTTNYSFTCLNCNSENNQKEIFERTTAGWKDICSTTIANLILEDILAHVGTDRPELFDSKHSRLMAQWYPEQYYFNKKEIIPYVDKHWDSICTERIRTPTWWATLGSCLYSSKETFVARDERQRSAASDFCLADANLWHIRPIQAATKPVQIPRMTKQRMRSDSDQRAIASTASTLLHQSTSSSSSASLAITSPPSQSSQSQSQSLQLPSSPALRSGRDGSNVKWRSATPTPSPGSASPVLGVKTVPTVFSSTSTDHPCNRFGFKYMPCEQSCLPLVAYQQADNVLGGCTISIADKSSYVSVAKDGLTVTTDRGFRMCRANVGVKEGNWYWEAVIQRANGSSGAQGPHVRVGWARREACLNGPVGYDAYGYGYRDLTGDKLFCSRPSPYGEPFATGDVIGLYISLPPRTHFKSPARKRIPIAYKDHLWFEEKDFRQSKEYEAMADPFRSTDKPLDPPPRTIPKSHITVYKNGVCQGVMFEDLFDFEDFGSLPDIIMARRNKRRKKQKKETVNGIRMRMEEDEFDGVRAQQWTEDPPLEDDGTLGYYPAVSVFQGGMVTCNFGPDFQYPPSPTTTKGELWKPMSQRYDEYMAEECVWDLLDEVSRSSRKKETPRQNR